MLNYVNTGIVFQEVPDEVTLAINISNCPCRCPGCHSKFLWENIGNPLTPVTLDSLVRQYDGSITCIAFMGGDAEPTYVNTLAQYIHHEHPELKVAWYSKHLGCLKDRTTNQRLYKKAAGDNFTDVTPMFWK